MLNLNKPTKPGEKVQIKIISGNSDPSLKKDLEAFLATGADVRFWSTISTDRGRMTKHTFAYLDTPKPSPKPESKAAQKPKITPGESKGKRNVAKVKAATS